MLGLGLGLGLLTRTLTLTLTLSLTLRRDAMARMATLYDNYNRYRGQPS